MDNGIVKFFNGKSSVECFNAYWFESFVDAIGKMNAWRRHYNEGRPYRSLERLTPLEYEVRSKRAGVANSQS